jgi:hypothetical protein
MKSRISCIRPYVALLNQISNKIQQKGYCLFFWLMLKFFKYETVYSGEP